MPPHAYLAGGVQLFTRLQPLSFAMRRAIIARPCLSFAEACLYLRQFLCPCFTSLHVHKKIPSVPTKTPFLYISTIFRLPIFTQSHPYNPHQKSFLMPRPNSQFRLCQEPNEQMSIVWTDTILISLCFPQGWAGITVMDRDNSAHSH